MKTRIFVFTLLVISLSSCHFGNDKVDVIVHNAVIYTMDENNTIEDALAIKDGIIVAIGPEREIMNQYDAPIVIDGQKRPIYPGFIDGHCHFLAYGLMMFDADLTGTNSFAEVLERVKKYESTRMSEWIIGRGWDQNDWKESMKLANPDLAAVPEEELEVPFPDKTILDSLYPNTPVYLTRIDGHAVLVNQKALDLANINASTVVQGGMVEVKNGKCTGILIDRASTLIENVMPVRTKEEKRKALLAVQEKCFALGLTTVDDAGLMQSDIELIKEMQASGELKMRIYAMMSDAEENYNYYIKNGIDTSSRSLTVRSFKFYSDGALGSRGACLLSPYEDLFVQSGRKEYGIMLDNASHFAEKAELLKGMGFQMNTHAIGDSANRVMLGIYKNVLEGVNDLRWRIEHAQVVSANDIDVFGDYSIIPSVQPTHATSDMPWAWLRLGKARVARAYIYKDLMKENGLVALGTDFPVEGISPFATFYAAVARKDSKGMPDGGFQMENALSREEAMRGMTIWNAIANFEERYKGSIEVGKVADMLLIDRDIMKCDEGAILGSSVEMLMLGGGVVYSK
jgi:predicted amidohydrolase YtcJ